VWRCAWQITPLRHFHRCPAMHACKQGAHAAERLLAGRPLKDSAGSLFRYSNGECWNKHSVPTPQIPHYLWHKMLYPHRCGRQPWLQEGGIRCSTPTGGEGNGSKKVAYDAHPPQGREGNGSKKVAKDALPPRVGKAVTPRRWHKMLSLQGGKGQWLQEMSSKEWTGFVHPASGS